MRRGLVAAAVLVSACGCRNNQTNPSIFTIAQIAGVWRGTSRVTAITGGECAGAALQSRVGTTEAYSMSVTQTGSALSAILTRTAGGGGCTYEGTAGTGTLSLTGNRCDVGVIPSLQCPDGSMRDLELVGVSLSGTISGDSMSGTGAETWNVRASGTRAGVGVLAISSRFDGSR